MNPIGKVYAHNPIKDKLMEQEKLIKILKAILKSPANPYILAVIALCILYFICNLTPIVFLVAALIWYCYKRVVIDIKSMLKFVTVFSFGQMLINTFIVFRSEFINVAGYQYVIYKSIAFFILSFVAGSIIFYIANWIFYLLGKGIKIIIKGNNPQ